MSDIPSPEETREHDGEERWELLRTINEFTGTPMIVLSLIWLVLLILDFTSGLSPLLQNVSNIIWGLFVLDFLLQFTIAPSKGLYLRRSWLTAISLMLPALRVFRIFRALRILRAARATRSIRMVRLITSLNRGMRALGTTFSRRGFGYAVALTLIVILAGAAGMLQFESPASLRQAGQGDVAEAGGGLHSYAEAIWWTAMLLTTIGSEYWPVTAEGRVLTWLLALYGLAVFSYITATIASLFITADSERKEPAPDDVAELREEVIALRSQIAALITRIDTPPARE